jgi:hypothetical protein
MEEMVAMDLEADLAEIQKPVPPAPFTPETIEQLFTTSVILRACGAKFENKGDRIWNLTYKGQDYTVTFYPSVFDETPLVRLMTFGEPIFETLLQLGQE